MSRPHAAFQRGRQRTGGATIARRLGPGVIGVALGAALCVGAAPRVHAQRSLPTSAPDSLSLATGQVDVTAVARDEQIRGRLQRVLDATRWFTGALVVVQEGVVFLTGRAESEKVRNWAGELAGRTQGVVAVVNRI
ncbi:MAG: BON domain-containing protein, partial [Gemmatimonadaceae bacterium]